MFSYLHSCWDVIANLREMEAKDICGHVEDDPTDNINLDLGSSVSEVSLETI